MVSVDGYNTAKVTPIRNSSIVDAVVNDGDLIVETVAGVQTNKGNVKGATGPTGPAGTIEQEDIDAIVDELEFKPWQNLVMTGNFEPYGSGFVIPRIRRNSDTVEMSGLVRYIGATVSFGGIVFITALPVEFRPVYDHVLWAGRGGNFLTDMRVRSSGIVSFYIYPEVLAIASGQFITLDNITYPLT